MTMLARRTHWLSPWLVFAAVSVAFFFLNLSTFTSLGVVLYTMVAELHWSMTAAGFSFTLLGIACGVSSPLPAMAMRWGGARATICLGAVLLMAGFYLASIAQSLLTFDIGMILLGTGYSFAGNIPAITLIAGWFADRAPRIIGLYLMLGALGAVFGPPIVEAMVGSAGGWRGYWWIMAIVAALIGVACLAVVRDAVPAAAASKEGCPDSCTGLPGCEIECPRKYAGAESGWSWQQAVATPQFLLVAAAMAATMAGVTTSSSVLVGHLAKWGVPPATAAIVLSVIAVTATLLKGIGGRLCEQVSPGHILSGGLALQALGNLAFAVGHVPVLYYGAAILFGAGWGLAFVAGTVVLLDYFGPTTGSRILSVVWLLTTSAAAGPVSAGMIADRYGTFSPIFDIFAAIVVFLAVPIFIMRAPLRQPASLSAKMGWLRGASPEAADRPVL